MSHPLLLQLASVDLIEATLSNDLFGMVCLVLLAMASIWSVCIISVRFMALRRAGSDDSNFQQVVDQDGSWESLFLAAKNFPESPKARLLRDIYVEIRMEKWFDAQSHLTAEGRVDFARQCLNNTLQRVMVKEEHRLQGGLMMLNTVCALAPFIGLLGTVWGVLASFQAIGREGSAALSALAPGISTALMTTIFGLFAAIPALIAFNWLTAMIRERTSGMEIFANDLEAIVCKQIAEKGTGGGK